MNLQIAKVFGLVTLLLALIAALVVAMLTPAPNPVVIGGLSTAFGVGSTVAFQWFTGGKKDDEKDDKPDDKRPSPPPTGPLSVLLVTGTILAAGNGCMPHVDTASAAAAATQVVPRADE